MRELDYLKELNKKYSRYLQKYFGFSIRIIAQKLGIKEERLCKIVKGIAQLPKDLEQKFIEIFNELGIEAKTKDFNESDEQKWMRGYWNARRGGQSGR